MSSSEAGADAREFPCRKAPRALRDSKSEKRMNPHKFLHIPVVSANET